MERVLAHVSKYAYIYGVAIVSLIVIVVIIMNVNTYETHVMRNLFKSVFFPRKEGFQDQQVVTGGIKIVDTISREHCEKLKEEIANYERVKIQHKDVPIQNLDETLTLMKEYFVSYNCE
jgi:hypothetical protein